MADSIDELRIGIKVDKAIINLMMYADDIIVVSPTKVGLQKQLNAIGKYGIEHGIKFNQLKCELLIFHKNRKRSQLQESLDHFQGQVTLNNIPIPEVTSFRYLGIIFSEDLDSTAHLTKRRQAAFAMLAKIEKLGFNNGCMKPQIIGNMFKTYIRPVLTYGLEILELNCGETKKVQKLEALILKRMIGIKQRCYTRHLFNSLRVGLTSRYLKRMKLKLFSRLSKNSYTRTILEEWNSISPKNTFMKSITDITYKVKGINVNGEPFTLNEKIQISIACLERHDSVNQKNDQTAKKLKCIYKMSNHRRMLDTIELLIHSKNNERGII